MSRTQQRSVRAPFTERLSLLRPTTLKRLGANVGIAPSGSHTLVQKHLEAPSPTWTVTNELNMEEIFLSGVDGAHADSDLVLCSHSHLKRSAYPRILRSGIPKPS
jgi:hypothetical protein